MRVGVVEFLVPPSSEDILVLREKSRVLKRKIADLDNLARKRLFTERGLKPVPPPFNSYYNVEDFAPVTARFVRFTILATRDGHEPCIDELEIYGPDISSNLARLKGAETTAASSLPGFAVHQIAHATDGRYGSWSWISAVRGKGWLQVKLPEAVKIQQVVWSRDASGGGSDRVASDYRIEVSEDGVAWNTVVTSKDREAAGKGPVFTAGELLRVLDAEQQKARRTLQVELDGLR